MTFHFDDITVMFLVWVLVLHPLVAWRGYRRIARGKPIGSKVYRFRLSLYVIVCSTLIALAVALVPVAIAVVVGVRHVRSFSV